MKKSIFSLVLVVLTTLSFVHLHAQDTPMYKAHFLTFTETVLVNIESNLNCTRDEAIAYQLKISLFGEAQLKKSICDRIPNFNGQWVFLGTNCLGYTEQTTAQTITDIYGAFHDPQQPIYQTLQNVKSQYNIQNLNPYIITQEASFTKKSENIMIRNRQAGYYDFRGFLAMITSSSESTALTGFKAPMPDGYPTSGQNEVYGTFGSGLVHKLFDVFEYKGDSLVYFTNDQGQPDSAVFSMGNRNVVDAFAWDNVFDRSGVDLGFQTNPLTIRVDPNRRYWIDIPVTSNDTGVGNVLYVGGDNAYLNDDPSGSIRYKVQKRDAGFEEIIAYAVEIPGMPGAFAMEYVLIVWGEEEAQKPEAPELTFNLLEAGTQLDWDAVSDAESYSVYRRASYDDFDQPLVDGLTGTAYLDESELADGTYYYMVTASNEAGESSYSNEVSVVIENVTIPAAPQNLRGNYVYEGVRLLWTKEENVTYNIYRSTESGKNYNQIAENIDEEFYIDDTPLSNGDYYYVITAENEAGESEYSNEEKVIITSVSELTAESLSITPNPAGDYIEISIDGSHLEGGHHLEIEIYDVLGERIIALETRHALSLHKIDISHLPKGVYFVKIGNRVEKFVKE